jgi:hypothetical protein
MAMTDIFLYHVFSRKQVSEMHECPSVELDRIPGRETHPPETSSPITVSMDGRISCRLYPGTNPNCLEIAPLQKGIVLMQNGEELIEEGIGFGAPVVVYKDRPYFSTSAEVTVQAEDGNNVLVKSFLLDAISRKRVGKTYVNDDFYKFFHEHFHTTYVSHKKLNPAFNWLMELRRLFRIKTEFVKVKPRGTVTVKYIFHPDSIDVNVSFSQLEISSCKEILILNEQGASFFSKYHDSNGLTLIGEQVGAMEKVNAEYASFATANGAVSFSLKNVKATEFFRGREKTRGRFSWAGFGYSLQPTTTTFQYTISLKSQQKRN